MARIALEPSDLYAKVVERDLKLLDDDPDILGDPKCPKCGHIHASYWNGCIGELIPELKFGSKLTFDDDDGSTEIIKCPKCLSMYKVIQHVVRNVTRTSEVI